MVKICKRGKKANEPAATVLGKGWTAQPVFEIGCLLVPNIQKIMRHWGLLACNTMMMLLSYPIGLCQHQMRDWFVWLAPLELLQSTAHQSTISIHYMSLINYGVYYSQLVCLVFWVFTPN